MRLKDHIFTSKIAPVLRLYGFDNLHKAKSFKDDWIINVGKEQNWVTTFIPAPSSNSLQYVLMMTLYDYDFASDAFLVKYEFDDDNKVKIIDERNDIDVSTFPTYDGLIDPKLDITLVDKIPLGYL